MGNSGKSIYDPKIRLYYGSIWLETPRQCLVELIPFMSLSKPGFAI
jgi:hypothetical protein